MDMPKVAYSREERENIKKMLTETALELMAKQGIQHTTVEQVYKKVGNWDNPYYDPDNFDYFYKSN